MVDDVLLSKHPRFQSLREVADRVGVTPATLARWVQAGKVEAVRTGTGRGRVFVNAAEAQKIASPRPAKEHS